MLIAIRIKVDAPSLCKMEHYTVKKRIFISDKTKVKILI